MNEHAVVLQMLMQKDTLTSSEIKEGVVACFFAINRDFVKRRVGDVSAEEIDSALTKLITRVFKEYNFNPEKPDVRLLKQIEQVLEDRTGFEAEPDLLAMHKEVIHTLFSRTEK